MKETTILNKSDVTRNIHVTRRGGHSNNNPYAQDYIQQNTLNWLSSQYSLLQEKQAYSSTDWLLFKIIRKLTFSNFYKPFKNKLRRGYY